MARRTAGTTDEQPRCDTAVRRRVPVRPGLPQFARYDDQQISFVDHASAVLAHEYDVEYVFTFDSDDIRTLGLTVVPDDTGEA